VESAETIRAADAARSDADASDTTATKPAPFDKGPVKIVLVLYSGTGNYFQLWTQGAQQPADAIGGQVQP
jgi:simple sugar transport system substrate-binding protein